MKSLLIILALFGSTLGNSLIESQLLRQDGWEVIETSEDGYTISQIEIPGYDMDGVKVSVEVNLNPQVLFDVIHDVNKYDSFLTSAKSIDFETLEQGDAHVIGYQHITVPYFSNRHYIYHFDLEILHDNNRHITGWELIGVQDGYGDFIQQMNAVYDDPVYLDEGVGRFIIEPISDSKVNLSYRLYMDIGGWIPTSLVEMSNRTGILNLVKDLVKEAEKRSKI